MRGNWAVPAVLNGWQGCNLDAVGANVDMGHDRRIHDGIGESEGVRC